MKTPAVPTLALMFFLITGLLAMTATADDLKPYAAADEGYQRAVIRLPALDDEAAAMVELMVGRVVEVDCNRVVLGGSLEHHVVQGWGYPYYRAVMAPHHATTMMACPPDIPPVEQFVAAGGEGFRIRYNSRLPVVVYVPDGYELRYRIWRAGGEVGRAVFE